MGTGINISFISKSVFFIAPTKVLSFSDCIQQLLGQLKFT